MGKHFLIIQPMSHCFVEKSSISHGKLVDDLRVGKFSDDEAPPSLQNRLPEEISNMYIGDSIYVETWINKMVLVRIS